MDQLVLHSIEDTDNVTVRVMHDNVLINYFIWTQVTYTDTQPK